MDGLCEAQISKAEPWQATDYPNARATSNEPEGGHALQDEKTCDRQEHFQSTSARMPVARCPAKRNNGQTRSRQRFELQTARSHKPAHTSDLARQQLHARGDHRCELPRWFPRASKNRTENQARVSYVVA